MFYSKKVKKFSKIIIFIFYKMATKLSDLPKPLLRKIISYLEPKCVKLSDGIIHELSKYIMENFAPHVIITHHYIKTSGVENCYKLYFFVGSNYEYINTDEDIEDKDSEDNPEPWLRPSVYLSALRKKINFFLKTNYGIFTNIEFKRIDNKEVKLDTEVYCKDWEFLSNDVWSDEEIIDVIKEMDSELVSGVFYEMTFSNMVKIKKSNEK